MFRLEINDPTEAEALISQNLVCQVTGIVYEVEEFRSLVSVKQCYNCQSFGHSAKTCWSQQKCLICRENHFHNRWPNREPKCSNCKGPRVASYKGCPEYKNRIQATCGQQPKNLCLNCKPKQSQAAQNHKWDISFTAEHLTKLVANVVIQITQPQVWYPNRKQDTLDLKSSHVHLSQSFKCSQNNIKCRHQK